MTNVDQIQKLLSDNDRGHATPLFNAIVEKAKTDPPYATFLAAWLTDGGTVLLRDELCRLFKDAPFIESQTDRRYPWWDNWTAIDSARLQARDLEDRTNNRSSS